MIVRRRALLVPNYHDMRSCSPTEVSFLNQIAEGNVTTESKHGPITRPRIALEIPKGQVAIDYLASFAPAFSSNQTMQRALGGVHDSFRQAWLIPKEPLALFACLTAEEEAASFLYHALVSKGYIFPDYKRLKDHGDKVKVLLLGQAIVTYFFPDVLLQDGLRIRISGSSKEPAVECYVPIGDYNATIVDPFSMIIQHGTGPEGFDNALAAAVDNVVDGVAKGHKGISSAVEVLKNRRNLSIYGPRWLKKAPKNDSDISHHVSNAVALLTCGFIIFFNHEKTEPMAKLLEKMFERLQFR